MKISYITDFYYFLEIYHVDRSSNKREYISIFLYFWDFPMIAVNRIRGSLLLLLLLTAAPTTGAHAEQLCAPFSNGKVKQHVVTTMLKAAKVGNLYRIDPSTSEVGFCVDSKFKLVKGNFKEIKGGIALEPNAVNNGQALLAIDAESVSTSSAMIENVIRSEAFFDVDNYPEILFVSTGFEWLSDTEGVLSGKLTLHGITKPVQFKVTLSDVKGNKVDGGSDAIQIKITTAIKRSDFGMADMTSMVSDKVRLCMNVQAKKPHT